MPAPPASLPSSPKALASSLTAWFARHQRALPWRKDRSAYRVWLSEVMLQQTRVAVVEGYYARFLARFPDVSSLAAADEDEVLSLWAGLGYYSRGRNLHKAARAVVADHAGSFPPTPDGLRALPGVGAYTAAAVASFAFGARAAVVDGNVARVLARLCDDHEPIDTSASRERMHQRALALVDAHASSAGSSAEVNEGLMELGALVCTPKSPSCEECPWQRSCAARKTGTALALPVKAKKRAPKAVCIASVVVVDDTGRVWLERRASSGLFGGLLEPPSQTIASSREAKGAWASLLRERAIKEPRAWPRALVVHRELTHRALEFRVLRVDVTGARGNAFVDVTGRVAISSAVRAVLVAAGVS